MIVTLIVIAVIVALVLFIVVGAYNRLVALDQRADQSFADIDVQLKDGVLTIKGEKKVEKDEKQKDYHVMERSYGMFERSFTLPAEVDASKVEAAFDKGVLKVTLPKLPQEQSKAQKIAVKPQA